MADLGTDQLLLDIADYVVGYRVASKEAVKTARYAVLDALGCGALALGDPECCKLLGPVVPGVSVRHGARVPGTDHVLDPVQAAFGISTAVRWLDFNDTWLAAEWLHPSDCLGAGRREICNAVSQAFVDGSGLRCFRHYPNVST